MSKKIVTIERHILDRQKLHPAATGEFTSLLYDIALAAKLIAKETTRAGLADILGAAGGENVYGERQQKLDIYADQVIYKINDHTGRLCAMASEEHEGILAIPPHYGTGKYVLLFDPLDGSSNIDVNVSVGTIFAIHRKRSDGTHGTLEDLLQPGRQLVAAGYVVYGSSTMLVYSTGEGVHGFTLDPTVGEFFLSHDDIRIPAAPKYYSINQGNERLWTDGVRRYTRWLQGLEADPDGHTRAALSGRYIGSLVADFHRNLLWGGVFCYPADTKVVKGKMRLMFEAQALAFLAEQAGGAATDGVTPILDLVPRSLHQCVPLFIGSADLVGIARRFIAHYDSDWLAAYRAATA